MVACVRGGVVCLVAWCVHVTPVHGGTCALWHLCMVALVYVGVWVHVDVYVPGGQFVSCVRCRAGVLLRASTGPR
jgi:hypothetical protein